ncbi:MAG TPA: bifunctional methylenetetrahydrofolate dehydrogenase/methenyltetrahydrofolate cyclohydrolase FolD [Kofleriaceae bacterium]|nr:bifunctional methylenetetrahydrofolate dehydrogenase/methenyltetrahydrofolate cyclohydrolase FolD [Kofleriaceae bacterium]
MSAAVLDGKAVAARVRDEVRAGVARVAERGIVPGLAVVLVGGDPASQVYVRHKHTAAGEVGVASFDHRLPEATTQAELLDLVRALGDDPRVHGILVQLPLPPHIDPIPVLDAIPPEKDVDGFHPDNIGRLAQSRPRFIAATPKGCMRLLAESGVDLPGAHAVVVGRSNIVGRPMALLLTNAHATVTVCHSKTRDLPAEVARADVLVAAIGRARAIRGEWIKPGAVVIDVGMNRGEDGKLCGDVDYAGAALRASAITPVPGGVGPMTIACLLENTLAAAERSKG